MGSKRGAEASGKQGARWGTKGARGGGVPATSTPAMGHAKGQRLQGRLPVCVSPPYPVCMCTVCLCCSQEMPCMWLRRYIARSRQINSNTHYLAYPTTFQHADMHVSGSSLDRYYRVGVLPVPATIATVQNVMGVIYRCVGFPTCWDSAGTTHIQLADWSTL